jgi:RNA polymerase sigma-70 factor (ECF subfamily)
MVAACSKSPGEMLVQSMPALFAYVRRRVGDLETAKEIFQEVSLRALAGTAPEEPESFLPWSCGIARYVIYGEWRRLRRIRCEQPPEDFVIDTVHDPGPQPDRILDARTSLIRAIRDDTKTFALLLRRYVDRESGKVLAKELGLTTDALRMRLMRIRASGRAQTL